MVLVFNETLGLLHKKISKAMEPLQYLVKRTRWYIYEWFRYPK